jgi:hypothetical protein
MSNGLHFEYLIISSTQKLLEPAGSSKQTPLTFLKIFVSLHREIDRISSIQIISKLQMSTILALVWHFPLRRLLKIPLAILFILARKKDSQAQ